MVEKGYFSSIADFARQSILDKLLEDYEIGIEELEPDLIKQIDTTPQKNKDSLKGK